MCLQDLQLGKGRFFRHLGDAQFNVGDFIPQNSRRVALFLSWQAYNYYDAQALVFVGDKMGLFYDRSIAGVADIILSPQGGNLLLRVEDVGSLIYGPFTIQVFNASGLAQASAYEILTDLEVKPAFTVSDLK